MRCVVFNQKGGVGKSTIACNLAAIAAARGWDTVILDLDPSGNSSRYLLGSEVEESGADGSEFFEQMLSFTFKEKPLEAFLRPTPFEGLRILCSNPTLHELESKLESRYKMMKLRDALDGLPADTAVYIDTPPALGFYSRSALIAAKSVLIPFDCDDFSRQALYTLLDNVREIQADHNRSLAMEGIVVNQFQLRANLPRQLIAELKSEGHPVLDTYISSSVKIRESHSRACPMIHLDPKHKLSGEFEALYETLTGEGKGASGSADAQIAADAVKKDLDRPEG
jgi:chromosome partitioning protein